MIKLWNLSSNVISSSSSRSPNIIWEFHGYENCTIIYNLSYQSSIQDILFLHLDENELINLSIWPFIY